jgi:UTP--glucose-1-phosphate uridylyltransferase
MRLRRLYAPELIDRLIFVTGRNKRAIEDHFDANLELEAALLAKEKHAQADMVHIM